MMGKRRLDQIQLIPNLSHRKVTYCKRKKGLLKKSIELSVLCDLKVFCFIYDESQQRVIHFASDPSLNIMDIFNKENQREYYTNSDYGRVGGKANDDANSCADEMDQEAITDAFNDENAHEELEECQSTLSTCKKE